LEKKKSKNIKSNKRHINIDLNYDGNIGKDIKVNKEWHKKIVHSAEKDGSSGFFYFMGFIGSAVYYISTATSFWMGFLGFLKAIVWPAFLVYSLLKSLGV